MYIAHTDPRRYLEEEENIRYVYTSSYLTLVNYLNLQSDILS